MNTKIVYEIVNRGYYFHKGMTFRIEGVLCGYALIHLLDGEEEDYGIVESMDISDTIKKARIHKATFFSGREIDPLKRWVEWINANIVY